MSSPPPVQLEVEVGDESMEEDSTDNMLPSERFAVPAPVDLWREKMSEGALTAAHFHDHWRVTVPRLFAPQPNRTCLDWSFDEEAINKSLLQPLEQFVWGHTDGVAPTPRRSTLCGRVFKQGEPAYSCRECGMDNTCVLCVECFKVSAHRHHKYKMGQSSGGGCCDCGDTEAWKRDPFCELHAAPPDDTAADQSVSPDVIERMKLVSSVCLSYSLLLLTRDHSPDVPGELKIKDIEKDPLQILEQPDCYCTVLYNDETHTFEQVITTLTRVTKYNHRDSVELVSLIDREGRAMVKCNSFEMCDKLKTEVEIFTSRHGSKLKVAVMHAHLVAHQTFAMKLLNWLQQFVSQEPSLRLAVSQVALGGEYEGSGGAAARVMQNDARMWKAARTAWHRLLIATTLMDYETKKAMAVLFTKNYASMMMDFIRDDHDHSFSISSLSVQLFTTPTLAHHLIAKHDALFVLLHTFVAECNKRLNDKGRLEFDRNPMTMQFKRAQFILYDVKYLLGSVPTSFDDDLRKGFLHGLTPLINLLVMMQGMDSIVRQVGQHTEYEPEWEGAFNLHVKLAHSVTLALQWCGADRALAAAAARASARRLPQIQPEQRRTADLGDQSASVIPYDVSSEPVSIHQPLSRFVAGLILLLHQHGMTYGKELARPDKPIPTPEELIEPVLRTMAMIGQVHAGMWRRNGFALLNQLYFYHNVKCRAEMLDRDVVMLQIGASLIESNEFIIHVMNKFNLLEWAEEDYEQSGIEDDNLRHTISLTEEFLGLLITIVGSRFVPGVGEVTAEDRTKKEIIQMLCVKPMAHSELNRCLPEDVLHETGLESVIHEVADFHKPPGGTHRGLYSLKPNLYDEYDTFFYHYTREDLSRSEEEQRNRRKAAGQPECCPPPALPKLTPQFSLIANLLQSESALHVIKTVLERALDLRARSFSETQVHKVLHLIGYALRDEESNHYEFLAFAECAQRAGVYTLLQHVANSARVDAHRPLANWLLAKMRMLLGEEEEGAGDSQAMETDQQDKQETEENAAETEKSRRARLAAERRAKLMAQMQAAQNKFITSNATLFETTSTEVPAEEQIVPQSRGVALGTYGGAGSDQPRVCIMCQEEARVDSETDPLVLVAFVQQSTVLSSSITREVGPEEAGAGPAGGGAAKATLGAGPQPHVSLCGHALHSACCFRYRTALHEKETRRPYRLRQPAAFDVERREYLCPLCERLCNTALVLCPPPPPPAPPAPTAPPALTEVEFTDAVTVILRHQACSTKVHECTEQCEEMQCQARACSPRAPSPPRPQEDSSDEDLEYVTTHSRELLPAEFLQHFSEPPPDCYTSKAALVHEFVSMLPSICEETESGGMASIAALYRATSYTVLAANAVLQAERRPLLGELPTRHRDALHSLIRIAAIIPCISQSPRQLAHHALTTLNTLEKTSPLLNNSFGVLVPLVLGAPSLFSKRAGPARPTHLARQITIEVFRANLTRALLVTDVTNCTTNQSMDEDEKTHNPDLDNLLTFMKEVRRGNLDIDNLCPNQVWDKIKEQCHSFLRCCCLFFHFLSDVFPSAELTAVGGDTWENMCQYLDLPSTYRELLDTSLARRKVVHWASLSSDWFAGNIPAQLVLEPKEPPKLIQLPDDFSELMNIVSEFSCPNSEREDSKYPTMCLVCGQILCSQSYCCQQEIKKGGSGGGGGAGGGAGGGEHAGAAVAHCARCGAGCGLFLRVRECEVLLLATPARGALLPAPYLDSYGETDQGLRRGNPLRLCPDRYEQLRALWLSHGVYERVARALDTNMLVATQWQNM